MAVESSDKRVRAYLWWHDAVFGPKPFKAAIPHAVLRGYLDWQWEQNRLRKFGVIT